MHVLARERPSAAESSLVGASRTTKTTHRTVAVTSVNAQTVPRLCRGSQRTYSVTNLPLALLADQLIRPACYTQQQQARSADSASLQAILSA